MLNIDVKHILGQHISLLLVKYNTFILWLNLLFRWYLLLINFLTWLLVHLNAHWVLWTGYTFFLFDDSVEKPILIFLIVFFVLLNQLHDLFVIKFFNSLFDAWKLWQELLQFF